MHLLSQMGPGKDGRATRGTKAARCQAHLGKTRQLRAKGSRWRELSMFSCDVWFPATASGWSFPGAKEARRSSEVDGISFPVFMPDQDEVAGSLSPIIACMYVTFAFCRTRRFRNGRPCPGGESRLGPVPLTLVCG